MTSQQTGPPMAIFIISIVTASLNLLVKQPYVLPFWLSWAPAVQ